MDESDLAHRVVKTLEESPNVTAREIALLCEVSRRAVERLLHVDLRENLERDAMFRWKLAEDSVIAASLKTPLLQAAPQQFITQFLKLRGLDAPDARELYAYRCTEAEFEALHLAISDLVDFDPLGRSRRTFAPLFVLYAAEWWRRHQGVGAWAWEPVFDSLELSIGLIMAIYPAVIEGLEAWRRPLLRSPHGRMFLVTLACEGGLPLQVIKTEGARLREFFRHVLEDYGLYSRSGVPAVELARRNAGYLRRSLRQEIVFELGGQLIETIWQLQARVKGAKDVVAELDALEPTWREQLPFEVGDDVASAFLNSLVRTAHRIRQGATEEFRLTRSIVDANGWVLQSKLSFPPSVDEAWMINVTGLPSSDLPQRGQFILISTGGKKVAALNMTQRNRGGTVSFVLERLGDNVRIDGPAAGDGWAIQFESNRGVGVRREVRGGSPLSPETPWVFVEADEGRWRFIGQGSVRTRFSECVVLVPASLGIKEGERIGSLFDREMHRIDRSLEIVDPDGGRFRVLLAQSEERASVVQIDGDRFALAVDDREIFQGAPTLREVLADERLRSINPASIEWRPVGTKAWRPWGPECVGRVAVRVVHDEETRFLQTVEIVPKNFVVRLKGESPTSGFLEIETPEAFHVRYQPVDDVSADVTAGGISASVHLRAGSARRVPATVEIQLDFGAGRSLTLTLPFPARGARYVGRGERILPFESHVSLEALVFCRLEVFATSAPRRFTIDAVLNSDDLAPSDYLAFAFDLPEPRNGRISLELRRLVQEIQSLLAETDDGEAFVSLAVDGLGPNKLNVRRYDVDFELSDDGDRATLPEPVGAEGTNVELMALWDPLAPRETLSYDAESGAWHTAIASRTPGPWLLLATTNKGVAIRPRLLQAQGELPERRPLAAAISLPNLDAKTAIRATLKEMIDRPLDEEWSAVALEIVKLSAELPASSFVVTASICSKPAAAVLVLIHAGTDRQVVWDTLSQAGFEWKLVPYPTWYETLDAFERALSEQLSGGAEATDDLAVKEVNAVLSFLEESPERAAMAPTWQFLRRDLFGVRAHAGSVVGLDPNAVIPALKSERTQLLTRQAAESRWPNGKLLFEQLKTANAGFASLLNGLGATGDHRPVIGAPLFAARCAAVNEHVRRRLRGELRRLRRFDVEWFETAYRLALVMYLNKAYPAEIDRS